MSALPKPTVAIHQPNYAPWLGYFHKMARADVFIFLDNVQFSKGSYTNRVQIAANGAPRWLTVPVRHVFGARIDQVEIVRADWARAHLDTLRASYAKASHFAAVWPDIVNLYESVPGGTLADINISLIHSFAICLGIKASTCLASQMKPTSHTGADRLVNLCKQISGNVTYLSGRGAAKYQDEDKFKSEQVDLVYTDFEQSAYPVANGRFFPGLSILDAVLNVGWDGTAALIGIR